MSKFNKTTMTAAAPVVKSPMTTTRQTTTFEGGVGFVRDTRSELLMLAITNMVGEDTYYEKADVRDDRFRTLVHDVATTDPEWMANFIPWLRTEAFMRSASIVAACEAVKARLDAAKRGEDRSIHDSFHDAGYNRRFIDAACARADEPGEVLAYWVSRYGKRLPMAVKRGVADAVARLYTERTYAKYDSDAKGYRFADVLDLVHPSPADDKPYQGDLFRLALDRRHKRDNPIPESLVITRLRADLLALPVAERRKVLLSDAGRLRMANAGMTWESVAGWLQGPMDAAAWEAIIPSMGAMALMRNLRNFDQVGVSDKVAELVCERLADPEQIARARVFPYRLYSAYKAAPSLRWGHALDKGISAACANVPALDGNTLVLVDTSGSMLDNVSQKSQVRHVDVGALIGVALAMRGNAVDLHGFASGVFAHNIVKGGSLLKQCHEFAQRVGSVGHGTEIAGAVKATFRPGFHKRVVIVTDMQTFGTYGGVSTAAPADVPMFGINPSGYAASALDLSQPNRYEIGGFSDKMFQVMALLASGRDAGWPWERG